MKHRNLKRDCIAMLLMLSIVQQTHACAEGHVDVPMRFSGTLKLGQIYKKDIARKFYFAQGKWGNDVKVPFKTEEPTFFWLVPYGSEWLVKVGPNKHISPDYIEITNAGMNSNSAISLPQSSETNKHSYCFVVDVSDYSFAMKRTKETAKARRQDLFDRECSDTSDYSSVGRALVITKKLTNNSLEFSVNMKIPTYRTDCPAPGR